jgi:predicted NBD/HSP70 family sugar kinase
MRMEGMYRGSDQRPRRAATVIGEQTEECAMATTPVSEADSGAPETPLSGLERGALRTLLLHGPKSRAEIARELGMSRASLTRVTRTLKELGLITEGAVELRGATGRPSELLHIRPEGRHFLGVKLTGDRLFAVVTDLTAQVQAEHDEPLDAPTVEQTVAQIGAVYEQLATEDRQITAAGIGLAGDVVTTGGRQIVAESPFLAWRDVPLAELARQRLGLPVAVENDVRALTAAEHWFGVGARHGSMVLITVGAGVGVGMVIDGNLVAGAHGKAGNLDHLPVDPSGPRCERGHRGCVNAYLSNSAIVGALRTPGLDYARAVDLARGGDPAATQAFRDAGHALGVLTANLANTIDPDAIVITGDGIAVTELARSELDAAIAAHRHPNSPPITLNLQHLAFTQWARAGAALAIRDYLNLPYPAN